MTSEEPKIKLLQLPFVMVKHIIKSDPEVNLINQEALSFNFKSYSKHNIAEHTFTNS